MSTNPRPLGHSFLTVTESDISTAGSVYVPVPTKGKVVKILSVIDGAIATADAVVTSKINGTNITGGVLTIATASSAAGDIDTCEPTAANVVNEGDYIELATSGASTNTVSAVYTVVISRTTN